MNKPFREKILMKAAIKIQLLCILFFVSNTFYSQIITVFNRSGRIQKTYTELNARSFQLPAIVAGFNNIMVVEDVAKNEQDQYYVVYQIRKNDYLYESNITRFSYKIVKGSGVRQNVFFGLPTLPDDSIMSYELIRTNNWGATKANFSAMVDSADWKKSYWQRAQIVQNFTNQIAPSIDTLTVEEVKYVIDSKNKVSSIKKMLENNDYFKKNKDYILIDNEISKLKSKGVILTTEIEKLSNLARSHGVVRNLDSASKAVNAVQERINLLTVRQDSIKDVKKKELKDETAKLESAKIDIAFDAIIDHFKQHIGDSAWETLKDSVYTILHRGILVANDHLTEEVVYNYLPQNIFDSKQKTFALKRETPYLPVLTTDDRLFVKVINIPPAELADNPMLIQLSGNMTNKVTEEELANGPTLKGMDDISDQFPEISPLKLSSPLMYAQAKIQYDYLTEAVSDLSRQIAQSTHRTNFDTLVKWHNQIVDERLLQNPGKIKLSAARKQAALANLRSVDQTLKAQILSWAGRAVFASTRPRLRRALALSLHARGISFLKRDLINLGGNVVIPMTVPQQRMINAAYNSLGISLATISQIENWTASMLDEDNFGDVEYSSLRLAQTHITSLQAMGIAPNDIPFFLQAVKQATTTAVSFKELMVALTEDLNIPDPGELRYVDYLLKFEKEFEYRSKPFIELKAITPTYTNYALSFTEGATKGPSYLIKNETVTIAKDEFSPVRKRYNFSISAGALWTPVYTYKYERTLIEGSQSSYQLVGTRSLEQRFAPTLFFSIYFRPNDIFAKIRETNPWSKAHVDIGIDYYDEKLLDNVYLGVGYEFLRGVHVVTGLRFGSYQRIDDLNSVPIDATSYESYLSKHFVASYFLGVNLGFNLVPIAIKTLLKK